MATSTNPAVQHATNQNQKPALHPYLKVGNFEVRIDLDDTPVAENEHPLLPDLQASVTSWTFNPDETTALETRQGTFDDEQDFDDSDVQDEDYSDLEDDDSEDDDSEDDDSEEEDLFVVGTLKLSYLVNRDTLVQRALVAESFVVTVTIVLKDDHGNPVTCHVFTGMVSERLHHMSGQLQCTAEVRDHLVVDVTSVSLWEPV